MVLAVVMTLFVSCRSTPGVLPLEMVVPPGTAHFALDPVPTPLQVDLGSLVAAVGEVAVIDPFGEGAVFVLNEVFPRHELRGEAVPVDTTVLLKVLKDAPSESFQISITRVEGQLEIVLAGADRAGRRWAVQTLRQLVCERDGVHYVRLGTIRDRPGFPLRGNKRPLAWEERYRANLSWENPGHEHFVPVFSPGGVLDATETGRKQVRRFFVDGHRRGARRFAIEFDDVGFDLTPESRELYGSYFFALTAYLNACREMLREIDPEAVLYWLPQTYWTTCEEFGPFARQVGLAGGVPADLGLVLTGPEVISAEIPAEEIARARRMLGLTATKAVIYDNLGREGNHGPLRGRGADLLAEVDSVFGERGEVLNRITRLDYSWNPEAYDPERSHLLACREVVGAAAAPYLHRLVLEIDRMSPEDADEVFRQVVLRTVPRFAGPVHRGEYLRHLRRWLTKRLNIDPPTESP